MGVIAQPQPLFPHPNHPNPIAKIVVPSSSRPNSTTSMSQSFHQGIFSFSDGFERSTQQQQQQQHIAQQSRRDKLRVQQGYEPAETASLVLIDEGGAPESPVYEAGSMLSEMFNFPPGGRASATDLLEHQIMSNYRLSRPTPSSNIRPQHQISGMNADSAAAMHLFLMNPQPRSPSPSPPASSSTAPLHMLLPNPPPPIQAFQAAGPPTIGANPIQPSQFTWPTGENAAAINGGSKMGGESQGLSLSLSSSLQQLEAAKAAEGLRMGEGVFYYNQGGGPSSSSSSYPLKNLGNQPQQVHVGFGSLPVMHVLRNSKYRRAAQDLLEEFCTVGRGHLKSTRHGKQSSTPNPNPNLMGSGGGGGSIGAPSNASGAGGPQPPSSSNSKDHPPLSPSDRFEHQRRKSKLLSMLDEVDRRYIQYCEQMRLVVTSFDSVMGLGAAAPYTSLAQKAMSRHFRCLKDAIAAQLKHTCELLGEKDSSGVSGVTKGETPRLRLLEQSLRQQRAFNQMGMMDQEAWRPQRGLPERSVNILRSWLFEHFLHPYPSDADKHFLARQTGLSRNQVSNWFINARVRLWKPMVEEMYQQESKEEEEATGKGRERERQHQQQHHNLKDIHSESAAAQTPTPAVAVPASAASGKRSEINAHDKDPSHQAINRQCFSETQTNGSDDINTTNGDVAHLPLTAGVTHLDRPDPRGVLGDMCRIGVAAEFGTTIGNGAPLGSTRVRLGTTGDVSLTLGLRHAGNMPEKNRFSIGDFGGC